MHRREVRARGPVPFRRLCRDSQGIPSSRPSSQAMHAGVASAPLCQHGGCPGAGSPVEDGRTGCGVRATERAWLEPGPKSSFRRSMNLNAGVVFPSARERDWSSLQWSSSWPVWWASHSPASPFGWGRSGSGADRVPDVLARPSSSRRLGPSAGSHDTSGNDGAPHVIGRAWHSDG